MKWSALVSDEKIKMLLEKKMKIMLSTDAIMPTRGDDGAAGYDLFSYEDITIPKWSRSLVKTGVHMEIPPGYYGRIASRSSMGIRCQDIGAGVIDSSYRGEIKVLIINSSNDDYKIEKGNKIAQIIFEAFHVFELERVANLKETERGSKGFGSTGM